jgi:predicted TIM-barrel fold metal-dependent hydrolase
MEDLSDQGFRGLRLAPMLRPDIAWYNTPQADRLWKMAGRLGLVLGLLITPDQVVDAAAAIQRFPQVKVVVDHLARPDKAGGQISKDLLALASNDMVYVKLSALGFMSRHPYPHLDTQEWIKQAVDTFGPDRLIWGTDTPMSQDPDTTDRAIGLLQLALPDLPEMGFPAFRLVSVNIQPGRDSPLSQKPDTADKKGEVYAGYRKRNRVHR